MVEGVVGEARWRRLCGPQRVGLEAEVAAAEASGGRVARAHAARVARVRRGGRGGARGISQHVQHVLDPELSHRAARMSETQRT